MIPLGLYNTSVRLSFFSETVSISKKTLKALRKKLENSPLPTHGDIQGIYLRGDHYFRKVHMANVPDLEEMEIVQATSVTPICEGPDLPFLLTCDQLEIYLPTEELDFERLIQSVKDVVAHFGDLAGYAAGMRIELPLRGAFDGQLSNLIYKQVLPNLPFGDYAFEVLWKDQTVQGKIELPRPFDKMHPSISQKASVIRSPYTVRMTANGNRFAVSSHTSQELGVILSAVELNWFLDVMNLGKDKGAFPMLKPVPYQNMPRFGNKG